MRSPALSAADTLPRALTAHWRAWLGATVDDLSRLGRRSVGPSVLVVPSPVRDLPGWDGALHPVVGVVDAAGNAVVSVPPSIAGSSPDVATSDLGRLRDLLPGLLGAPERIVYRAVYRWCTEAPSATSHPDVGTWLPADDGRVPAWLLPFGGEVLVVLEADHYVAGVGLKRHDDHGREVAVGTEPEARGRGLARRLVAQAARRVLDEGGIATYQHDARNVASARVADAAGFPDLGWASLGTAPVEG
jgi:GNAT superfamily N-acetyltransferase